MKTKCIYSVLIAMVMVSCGSSKYFSKTYEDDIYFSPKDATGINLVKVEKKKREKVYDAEEHFKDEKVKEEVERWLENPNTRLDTTIKFKSKGWVNFSGGDSDLDYAERMRRWYGPTNYRHMPIYMYDKDWLASDPDWNVYVDGDDIFYVPSWSNPMYQNYRYGVGLRHNFFSCRMGWMPYHNFYGRPFSYHYGHYDPYWHDWYYTWNDPFMYDSFYGHGFYTGFHYASGYGYGMNFGYGWGYPYYGYGYGYPYGYGYGYPYYGYYGSYYGGNRYYTNRKNIDPKYNYSKDRVQHQSFRRFNTYDYNSKASKYNKKRVVNEEFIRKYSRVRPSGNKSYSNPKRGNSSSDYSNSNRNRRGAYDDSYRRSTRSTSSSGSYNSGSSSTTRTKSTYSGSGRRRR